MVFHLVKRDFLGQLSQFPIHAGACVSLPSQLVEFFAVFPFASPYQRGQNLEARGRGELHHLIDNLLHGLRGDDASAAVAMGCAYTGEEETEIIVDLCNGAHSRARVLAGSLLLDGNGRR